MLVDQVDDAVLEAADVEAVDDVHDQRCVSHGRSSRSSSASLVQAPGPIVAREFLQRLLRRAAVDRRATCRRPAIERCPRRRKGRAARECPAWSWPGSRSPARQPSTSCQTSSRSPRRGATELTGVHRVGHAAVLCSSVIATRPSAAFHSRSVRRDERLTELTSLRSLRLVAVVGDVAAPTRRVALAVWLYDATGGLALEFRLPGDSGDRHLRTPAPRRGSGVSDSATVTSIRGRARQRIGKRRRPRDTATLHRRESGHIGSRPAAQRRRRSRLLRLTRRPRASARRSRT